MERAADDVHAARAEEDELDRHWALGVAEEFLDGRVGIDLARRDALDRSAHALGADALFEALRERLAQ
jgi:hypothetical protein